MSVDPGSIAAMLGIFLLAGAVKGVVGLGLPTISVGLLTATLGLHPAMALMLAPTLVTNVVQATGGGHGLEVLRRIWPFLLAASGAVWLGAQALVRVNVSYLSALLGVVLIVYALLALWRAPGRLPHGLEAWVGAAAGALNGILGGMTGAFSVPGVFYLQALGLPRDRLIQAMGMLFTVSSLALGLALGRYALLSVRLLGWSVAAVLPALAGMALGRRLRSRIPEARFRTLFLLALLVLGVVVLLRR